MCLVSKKDRVRRLCHLSTMTMPPGCTSSATFSPSFPGAHPSRPLICHSWNSVWQNPNPASFPQPVLCLLCSFSSKMGSAGHLACQRPRVRSSAQSPPHTAIRTCAFPSSTAISAQAPVSAGLGNSLHLQHLSAASPQMHIWFYHFFKSFLPVSLMVKSKPFQHGLYNLVCLTPPTPPALTSSTPHSL